MEQKIIGTKKMYSMLYIGAGLMHAIYLAVFILEKCPILVAFNVVSVIVYLTISRMALNEHSIGKTFPVCYIEVVLFSCLSTLLFGIGHGFSYLLFAIIPFIFYITYRSKDDSRKLAITYCIIVAVLFFAVYGLDCWGGLRTYTLSRVTSIVVFYFNAVASVILLIGFLAIYVAQVSDEKQEIMEDRKNLETSANYDALTKLLNRRSLDQYMSKFLLDAAGYGKDFAVLMCDIDDFKKVNDTYGHDCGDMVLVMVADTLKRMLRSNDIVFRWGGEEILILVSGGRKEAELVAERCRSAIEANEVEFKDQIVKVTMTIGGCAYYQGVTRDTMIERADKNLYSGKHSGKNKVVMV